MNEKQPTVTSQQKKYNHWKQHIESWNNSGLTQVAYCDEQCLNLKTFQYWKRKFNRPEKPRTLLPVAVTADSNRSNPSCSSGISICIKERFVLRLENEFNSATLSKLIDMLEVR